MTPRSRVTPSKISDRAEFAPARILHDTRCMEPLIGLFLSGEDEILARVFAGAQRLDDVRFTAPPIEAWRGSVRRLATALTEALSCGLPLDADANPLTRHAREQAQRNRARGVTLSVFLRLAKAFREAFADRCTAATEDLAEQARRRHLIATLFDHLELTCCEVWSAPLPRRDFAVLEGMPEAVFVLGSDGQVVHANPPALALLRLNLPPPAWLSQLVQSTQLELEVDGHPRSFFAQVSPVQGTGERVVVLCDLTERLDADRERRELRAVLDAVARSAADGIVMLDGHSRITFWSHAAERMFGWARDEVLGRDAFALFAPVNLPARAHGSPPPRLAGPRSCRVKRRDGTELDLEVTLSDVPAANGQRTLAVVRDVTERRRMEASSRLEAVGRLAGGIAHEINTPVQFVGDSLNLLRDATQSLCTLATEVGAHVANLPKNDPWVASLEARLQALDVAFIVEEAPRAVDRAIEGVNRVADLVRAMKDFDHPGTRDMAPADLNRAVRSALVISRPSWKLVARTVFDEGELPPVVCHVDQLGQVLLNLIVNASDAIRERGEDLPLGTITVRTRLDGADAVVEIADTGVGIASEHAPHIFQASFTTKEPGRGTGQGLALARQIVTETHHGTLTFHSTRGVGTTFTLRIPVAGVACAAA